MQCVLKNGKVYAKSEHSTTDRERFSPQEANFIFIPPSITAYIRLCVQIPEGQGGCLLNLPLLKFKHFSVSLPMYPFASFSGAGTGAGWG